MFYLSWDFLHSAFVLLTFLAVAASHERALRPAGPFKSGETEGDSTGQREWESEWRRRLSWLDKLDRKFIKKKTHDHAACRARIDSSGSVPNLNETNDKSMDYAIARTETTKRMRFGFHFRSGSLVFGDDDDERRSSGVRTTLENILSQIPEKKREHKT